MADSKSKITHIFRKVTHLRQSNWKNRMTFIIDNSKESFLKDKSKYISQLITINYFDVKVYELEELTIW